MATDSIDEFASFIVNSVEMVIEYSKCDERIQRNQHKLFSVTLKNIATKNTRSRPMMWVKKKVHRATRAGIAMYVQPETRTTIQAMIAAADGQT